MPFLTKLGWNLPTKLPPGFPPGVLILYSGADPGITGWESYTAAQGYSLIGTSGTIAAGTLLEASWNSIFSTAGFSIGNHTGSISFTTIFSATITGTAGPTSGTNNSAGAHSHSSVTLTFNNLTPTSINFHMLRSTTTVIRLPANAVVFKETAPTAAATELSPAGSTVHYISILSGGTGSILNGTSSQFVSTSSGTGGAHSHSGANTRALGLSGGGFNSGVASNGNHFHSVNSTWTQTIWAPTTIVKAYRLTNESDLEIGMIVGFLGAFGSVLPAGWRFCDGTGGTLDLRGRYPALRGSSSWGTLFNSQDGGGTPVTTGISATATHNHQSEFLSNIRATTPGTALHTTQGWSHDHSFTTQYNSGAAMRRIAINFIQYVGV